MLHWMKWTPWISANVEEESLVLASPEDIASMKLSAITNRGTKKYFIDLYELLDHFSLEQMFGFYREKYTDAIPFMTLKSLAWFEDAEEDPMPFMLKNYSWENVKTKIIAEVARLG